MKIKICGIKYLENLKQIQALAPDYLGFIFYEKSKRYMANSLLSEDLAQIPNSIKKVGVFVNETSEYIIERIQQYQLNAVQLHGNETAEWVKEFIAQLEKVDPNSDIEIIKAFGVDEQFNFNKLNDYKQYCNYFLFDTKTSNYGGSGRKFDWSILQNYDNEVPLFLSGGIAVEDISTILKFKHLNIYALDLNSQLEIEPGLKNIDKVTAAIQLVNDFNAEQI